MVHKINWKWPKTVKNNYFPWYLILWHCVWIVPIYISRILFVFFVLINSLDISLTQEAWVSTA